MNCKDISHSIDLNQMPDTILGKIRFKLHLILCQACKDYFDITMRLRNAMRSMLSNKVENIEKTNQGLIEKFAAKAKNK
jgi:hypothetical protein